MTQGFRFVGSHPDELESGQPIEPGQFIRADALDAKAPKNQQLIADGLLIDAKIPKELPDGHPETLAAPQEASDNQTQSAGDVGKDGGIS
jgi:hypothetical protein